MVYCKPRIAFTVLTEGEAMAATALRSRERPEKILVAMYKLSDGSTRPLQYEDIVVRAFEMFPDEFALRGYPKFPDSSDVHKPLYGVLKKSGYVRSASKSFGLTARGVEKAEELLRKAGEKVNQARDARRMTRDVQLEVERMIGSAAYRFFVNDQAEKILDTDFFSFLGCTVRTPPNDFVGRMATVDAAVETATALGQPDKGSAAALRKTWHHLRKRFHTLIVKREGES
jgi:hypothetical protein